MTNLRIRQATYRRLKPAARLAAKPRATDCNHQLRCSFRLSYAGCVLRFLTFYDIRNRYELRNRNRLTQSVVARFIGQYAIYSFANKSIRLLRRRSGHQLASLDSLPLCGESGNDNVAFPLILTFSPEGRRKSFFTAQLCCLPDN